MPDDLENRDKEVHVQLFNDHIWQFSFSYKVYKKYILSFKLCYFNTKQFLFFKKIQFSNDGLFNLKSICIYIRLFHCSKKEDLSKQECFPYSHAASENQRNKKTRNL